MRLQTVLTKDHERLSACPIEIKLAGDTSKGAIEGYASTFNGRPDTYGDVVAPGAFAETVAFHRSAGTMPAMLWGHDASRPVGRWLSLTEDGRGLRAAGQLNLGTDGGREAYAHLKAGDVTGLSIGFSHAVRQLADDGTRRVLKARLHEISFTPIPSDERARVKEVKAIGSRDELEAILTEAGVPRGAARKIAAGGYGALADPAAAEPQPNWDTLARRMAAASLEIRSYRKKP